jgi:uncharacterized protein (TIGR02284 family)
MLTIGSKISRQTAKYREFSMASTLDLDRIIETCIDSQKRYEHAAGDVGKDYLERFFRQQAAIRKQAAAELMAQRNRLGNPGEQSGSFAGTLDRAAMDVSVAMSMGDTGVVEWCRKDAERANAEYEKALRGDLPAELRPLIEKMIQQNRDTIAELEHVLKVYGGPRSE